MPLVKLLSDDADRLHAPQPEPYSQEQGLPPKDLDLIGGYYQGETSVKIHNRRSLAAKLGVPLNALRIRALRIRERLEACVEGCLKASPTG